MERIGQGPRDRMTAEVMRRGGCELAWSLRLCVRNRQEGYPTRDEAIVAAPAVVADKSKRSFGDNWRKLAGTGLWHQ